MSTQPQNPEKNSSIIIQPPEEISKPQRKNRNNPPSKPTKKDFNRFAKWRTGLADDEISQEEGNKASVLHVRESIQRVLAWQQINALPIVTASAHEVILKHISSVDQIIGEFAQATKTRTVQEPVTRKTDDGEVTVTRKLDGKDVPVYVTREIVEIDYNTRARVLETLKDLRDMVASKESKTNVNFGTQVGTVNNIGGRSFEDRVRQRREARGLKDEEDSEESQPVQDAEFEDIDPDNLDGDGEEITADESSS